MKAGFAALAVLCTACGYRAVYGGEGGERLHVVLARSVVVDAIAAGEVVSGVREELARAGALARALDSEKVRAALGHDGPPRKVVFIPDRLINLVA